ncbi:unnamed protein product [Paramecium primaurelia]|uniref:Uncharacterized protein n=1 Tax=Paramecium primaurelia TaxID=5886 RepID=A0A8S1L1M8_PARPR|nr:unnamed protein product [Paramecium primaurelia]
MKKMFQENEELRKNLKYFVESQKQVLRWPLIAQQLETLHDIKIDIPYELKQIYQDYCCPKPEIESNNLQILMQTIIECRCDMSSTLEKFVERSGIKISCYLLTSRAQQIFKKAIEKGIMVFVKNKTEQKKRLTNFPKANIVRLIKCLDLKPNNEHCIMVIDAANCLKELLLTYSINKDKDRSIYYEEIKQKMNKNQFFRTLLCLSFLDDLRMISQNLITQDKQLLPDYFLQDSIEKNKKLDVYQFLYVSDMQLKYQMYNDSKDIQQDQEFKYYIEEFQYNKFKKLSKELIQEKPLKRSIQTVRGKIITNTKYYPSKKTIKFNKDLDKNFDEQDDDSAGCYRVDIPLFKQKN